MSPRNVKVSMHASRILDEAALPIATAMAGYDLRNDGTFEDFLTRAVRHLSRMVPQQMNDIEDLTWVVVTETAQRGRAEPGKFQTFSAALGYARTALVRRAAHTRHAHAREALFQQAASGMTADPQYHSRTTAARLLLAELMKGVPERSQRVLVATECYGYYASEVAEAEGVSVQTVYNLKNNAISALRERTRELEAA